MKKTFILMLIFVCIFVSLPQTQLSEFHGGITAIAENSTDEEDKASKSEDEEDKTSVDEDKDSDEDKDNKKNSDENSDKKSASDDESKKNDKKNKNTDNEDDEDSEKAEKESGSKKDKSEGKNKSDKGSSEKSDSDDASEDEYTDEEEYIIHADKYLVYDLNYNVTLISKNSSKRINPAGLAKILTAITVIENVDDINQKVTVPEDILRNYDYSYANVGLKSGEEITYMNLLKLMMMRDAGDCAVALSHLCLDSYNNFIKAMNNTAKKAGTKNSYFDNPAGFTSSKNYSTLDDLCLIIKYALSNEIFCEAASCSTLEIPSSDPEGTPKRYFNRNYYMSTFYSLDYFNENIKHGKEYTINKDNTGLFVNYNNGFNNMICICAESDADDEINYAYEDINILVKTATSDFTVVSIIQKDEIITEVPLRNGADSDRVLLVSDESIRTKLANDYDPLKINKKVILDDNISAPVKKGEQLGAVTVTYNGATIGHASLVAFSEVDSSIMKLFMHYFDTVISSGWFRTVLFLIIAAIIGYSYIKYKSKNKK